MEPSPAPALDRGLRIVALIRDAEPAGVTYGDITRHLEISNSVASRLLSVLNHHGWVVKAANGRYQLTHLGHRPVPSIAEQVIAHAPALLADLAESCRATALLVVRDGDAIVHAAKHLHPHGMVMRDVGSRRGVWNEHPWAWAMADTFPAAERQALLAPEGATDIPVSARNSLHSHGWATRDDDTGQRMAAAILTPDGQAIGAVALGGNLPAARHANLGAFLLRTAESFSRLIKAKDTTT